VAGSRCSQPVPLLQRSLNVDSKEKLGGRRQFFSFGLALWRFEGYCAIESKSKSFISLNRYDTYFIFVGHDKKYIMLGNK
jgi:hypothetical protein